MEAVVLILPALAVFLLLDLLIRRGDKIIESVRRSGGRNSVAALRIASESPFLLQSAGDVFDLCSERDNMTFSLSCGSPRSICRSLEIGNVDIVFMTEDYFAGLSANVKVIKLHCPQLSSPELLGLSVSCTERNESMYIAWSEDVKLPVRDKLILMLKKKFS